MQVFTDPEATTERLGQLDLNTETSKFRPTQRGSEIIHLNERTKLISNRFECLSFLKLHKKVMELDPYDCSIKFSKSRFKERFPW